MHILVRSEIILLVFETMEFRDCSKMYYVEPYQVSHGLNGLKNTMNDDIYNFLSQSNIYNDSCTNEALYFTRLNCKITFITLFNLSG